MATYYVETGARQLVVRGDNPVRAALWAVHCWLQRIVPNYDDPTLSDEDRHFLARAEAALMLDPCVVVSRMGESGTMTHELNSDALVDQWSRLMIALTRLESAIQQRETCDGAIVADAA